MKATQLSAWFLLACIMSNTVTAMYTSPIMKKKLDLHKPLGGVSFLSVDEHNDVQQIQADSLNDLEIQPETAGAPMPSLDVQQQALALLKQQLESRHAAPAAKAASAPEQRAASFLQFENRESDDVTIVPEGDARAPPAEIQQKALELLRQRQAQLTADTPRLKSLARVTAKAQPPTPAAAAVPSVVGPVTVAAVDAPVPVVHVAAPESSNPGSVTLSLPEDALKEVMAAREGIAGPQLTDKPNANPIVTESTVSAESPRPAPAAQYKANDKYPVLGGSVEHVNQFVGRPLTNYPVPSTAANGPVPFYNQPAYNNAPQIVPNQPMMNQPMNQQMNQQQNQEPRFSRQSPMPNVGPAQMGYAPQLANMQMPMTQDMNMGPDNFNDGYAPMQNGDWQNQQLAMNPYVNRNYEAEVADSVPVGQTSFGPSSMEDPNLYRFKGRLQNRQTTNNMNTMGMMQRQLAQQQHMNQQLNQYMNLGVNSVYSMDKSPSVPVRNVYHNEPVSVLSTYGQQQQPQMAPVNSPRFASREAPVESVPAQGGMPQDMSAMSQSVPVMEFNPESMNQNNMNNNMQTYQQSDMAPMDNRNMNAVDMQPPMMGSQYDQFGGVETAGGMPMMS